VEGIGQAIRGRADELKWSAAKVAAEAGVSEQSARGWMDGKKVPSGDALVRLMKSMPGLREALLNGSTV
jgi:transcriptional regulator with XRE-family HTH domain